MSPAAGKRLSDLEHMFEQCRHANWYKSQVKVWKKWQQTRAAISRINHSMSGDDKFA
jgi:hypothetical protein